MNPPKETVVVVPCSGIGKPFGTVSRKAAYELCEELRPESTRLVALAKLVLGEPGARDLVAKHPAVTIDGCQQRCAANMVRQSGGRVAREVAVLDVFRRHKDLKPEGIAELNEAGRKLARVLAEELAESLPGLAAERLAALVDQVLGRELGTFPSSSQATAHEPEGEQREATCSCGSGVPVTKVTIDGQTVELVALPLIFRQFREAGRRQDEEAAHELFETVKIYNAVPPDADGSYREAVLREYAAYREKEKQG